MRGLALALVMILGALALTGLLATGLQDRAEERAPVADHYSPASDAIVDSSGWPIEERKEDGAVSGASTERSRSRPSSGATDSGA
jgi:hypothetical protein